MNVLRQLWFVMAVVAAVGCASAAPVSNDSSASTDSVAVDSLPVLRQYEYFFSYLPTIAGAVHDSENDMAMFLYDPHVVNTTILNNLESESPFSDSDIQTEGFRTQFGDIIWVWTFPMPHESPMPLYVAFVPDGSGHLRCYYLERSVLEPWVIGTMNNGHSSFVALSETPATAEDFLLALEPYLNESNREDEVVNQLIDTFKNMEKEGDVPAE
ncbi:MAG: hypothetical protein HDS11_05885 [Bacteroides sp.]|nr:hypothetical protein [Bacteroides sp.]